MASLPESVQEIADVIGEDAALHLIEQLPRWYARDPRYPNSRAAHVILYVPKRLKPDNPLIAILGTERAARLVAEFPGATLHPATCAGLRRERRNQEIRRRAAQGEQTADLARAFQLTDRQIRNLTSATRVSVPPANDD